jgi:hypothetical protein
LVVVLNARRGPVVGIFGDSAMDDPYADVIWSNVHHLELLIHRRRRVLQDLFDLLVSNVGSSRWLGMDWANASACVRANTAARFQVVVSMSSPS